MHLFLISEIIIGRVLLFLIYLKVINLLKFSMIKFSCIIFRKIWITTGLPMVVIFDLYINKNILQSLH